MVWSKETYLESVPEPDICNFPNVGLDVPIPTLSELPWTNIVLSSSLVLT